MAKRFSTLQKEAAQQGFELTQTASGFHAEWEGIGLDDDDAERLFGDMAAVQEVSADDSGFTLEEEPDEEGQAIIRAEGLEGDFRDLSIGEALRKAKEAKLAKEKPAMLNKPTRSFGRKPKEQPTEAANLAQERAAQQAEAEEVEPWVDPPAPVTNGSGNVVTQGDREAFLEVIENLAGAMIEARDRIKALLAKAPVPASERLRAVK